jgi:hypothetical protein
MALRYAMPHCTVEQCNGSGEPLLHGAMLSHWLPGAIALPPPRATPGPGAAPAPWRQGRLCEACGTACRLGKFARAPAVSLQPVWTIERLGRVPLPRRLLPPGNTSARGISKGSGTALNAKSPNTYHTSNDAPTAQDTLFRPATRCTRARRQSLSPHAATTNKGHAATTNKGSRNAAPAVVVGLSRARVLDRLPKPGIQT